VQIPPDYNGADIMTPAVLGRLQGDGLEVWVFMNGAEQETKRFYRQLIAKGVDGLIVGRPDALADVMS
jgi:glycerophosphoryl diester phosphodiesterase